MTKKKNDTIKKWTKDLIDIFPKRHTNGQQVGEKLFNITNHQGIANQNYNEISSRIC